MVQFSNPHKPMVKAEMVYSMRFFIKDAEYFFYSKERVKKVKYNFDGKKKDEIVKQLNIKQTDAKDKIPWFIFPESTGNTKRANFNAGKTQDQHRLDIDMTGDTIETLKDSWPRVDCVTHNLEDNKTYVFTPYERQITQEYLKNDFKKEFNIEKDFELVITPPDPGFDRPKHQMVNYTFQRDDDHNNPDKQPLTFGLAWNALWN